MQLSLDKDFTEQWTLYLHSLSTGFESLPSTQIEYECKQVRVHTSIVEVQ